jgi:hypothetical protein
MRQSLGIYQEEEGRWVDDAHQETRYGVVGWRR